MAQSRRAFLKTAVGGTAALAPLSAAATAPISGPAVTPDQIIDLFEPLPGQKALKIFAPAAGGKPEFAATNGAGRIFFNIEDTSELGVIDSKAARFVPRKLAMGGVPRQVAIEIGSGAIDAEDCNILQQRREENVVRRACVLQRAEASGRRGAQNGAPPIAVVIHTVAL